MLTSPHIDELARQLQSARASRVPVRQFSKVHPDMSLADAYAVQRAWVHLEIAAGRTIKGRKIGLTSRAIQQAFQAEEPTHTRC